MDNLTYVLDGAGGAPLYEQLYRLIARDITQGTLACGARLPSRRALSRHLGVSEQTANTALELLKAEGFLRSHPRRGLYVEQVTPLSQPNVPTAHKPLEARRAPLYDFSPQGADIRLFPHQVWTKLVKETLVYEPELLGKGDPAGEPSLRESLSIFLYQYRGVRCGAENLVIGSGVDPLLGTLGALLDRPTRIAFEDPGYPEAARALERAGHCALPVRMDGQGIRPESMNSLGASLVYLTPAHQFPTGLSMPAGRRAELLYWAREEANRYLIEDDYDSEFRYASRPLPALQGMGAGEETIYIGTFSRSLAPGIRVAYMALPEKLMKRYNEIGLRSGEGVSRFEQRAMARLVAEGHYVRHLRRASNVYKKRCETLCALLALIPGSWIKGQEAGLHFTFGIQGKSEGDLVEKAEMAGVPLRGLSAYCKLEPPWPALVLGFAGIADEQVQEAVLALRRAWGV